MRLPLYKKGWTVYETEAWRHGVRMRANSVDELLVMIDRRDDTFSTYGRKPD